MPLWLRRASFRIASIVRFHSNARIEALEPTSSHGAETIWFVKVVCTLCIYRASSSNLNIFSLDYFRKHLNPFVAFKVIQHISNQFNNPRLAFNFFRHTRVKLNLVHSISTFDLLLGSLCQLGLHDSAKLVFDFMNADGYLSDSSILELLVCSFANVGKFKCAKEMLVSEAELSNKRERIVPSFVYNKFLHFLVKREHVNEAVDFFKDHILRLRSFFPTTSSFNIVIRGLCATGEVGKAFEYFGSMGSFGCSPDTVTYNSLINGFCKIDNLARARKLLEELQSQGGISPDVVTYTSIISGCCKLGKMDEAESLFREMIAQGIRPNSFTFNILIDGYGKIGNMVSALKSHQRMLLCGCPPDVITYTSLIKGHCHVGDLDKGLKLWEDMDAKKLRPNLYTFSVLIDALCKNNKLDEARVLLRQLQMRDDIVPRPFIYNPVIDGFCKAGNVDEANIIVQEMEEKRCPPDKLTFTILILGHCMKGRMTEAISIFNKMLAVDCTPDKITVNSLASCLLKAGMAREAYRIKQTSYVSSSCGSSLKRTIKPNMSLEIPVAV